MGEMNQKSHKRRKAIFLLKDSRIGGCLAYSDGTRKDFSLFASFGLGVNKIKVEHIENIHYNFLLSFKMAREHLVKDSGLYSPQ